MRRSKYQAANVLSCPETKDKNKKTLDKEVLYLTVFQKVFTCALQTKIADFEFIEDLKNQFARFDTKVCMIAGITKNEKTEILSLAELITV